jgi:L-ascorbate metabolism protein UlaG (beta-lactamase superfamily)
MKSKVLLICLIIVFQTAVSQKITESPERFGEPHVLKVDSNINLVSFGSVVIFGNDFFPSSFMIESVDKVVFIDPVVVDSIKKADYIFITHGHSDHFSIKDINKIVKDSTLIICPKGVAKKLEGYNYRVAKPGDKLEFGSVICETYPSYSLGFPSHPKKSGFLSYVINVDGVRFFHPGDSDLIPELQGIKKIDVAMIPIDGGNLTMATEEATKLINTIKPKKAIPMHYLINKGKTAPFRRLVNKSIEVIIFEE